MKILSDKLVEARDKHIREEVRKLDNHWYMFSADYLPPEIIRRAWDAAYTAFSEQGVEFDEAVASHRIIDWLSKYHGTESLCPTNHGQLLELLREQFEHDKSLINWAWEDRAAATMNEVQAKKDLKEATDILNKIASWDEGEEVSGAFDNPHDAKAARDILIKLKAARK